jgi:serine/threonine-protein kinase
VIAKSRPDPMRECPKCHKRFLESSARICDVDGAVLDLVVVASDRDRLVGTTVNNRYRVDKVLGDGGMGVVYRAVEIPTGKPFAMKVLRAEYSAEEDLVLRFEQEARAADAIKNPHIVEIVDWGSLPDNSRFFVMEYLEGRSLGDLMARMPKAPGADRRQPMPEDFALHISMQIADGLSAAHAIGIVHRDIKPDNFHIVRRPDDPYFVKILDFGIAKVQNSKAARTRTGSVFGTPHYMSPEQASGDKNIDDKTDIYGLGVLMYEMVVGKIPFDAENLMGILTAHLYHTPVPPSVYPECEKLSRSFEAVILKCLAKERDARYASMADLYRDLERCRNGSTSDALEDQEISTRRFDRSDFAADAATVIRQLPPSMMQPASADELNAALGFNSAPPSAPSAAPPPSPAHSMSLPAPAPASMASGHVAPAVMASAAPPRGPAVPQPASPFEAVGSIRFADPNMPGALPDTVSGVSLPPDTEEPPPRSNKTLIAAILGLGALIAVLIVALATLQSSSAAPRVREGDPALAVAQQQLQPGRVLPSSPNTDAQAPAVPHGVPAAQGEPVVIQTSVPGVQVYRGGQRLGVAPHMVTRPSAGEETYTLSLPGYQEQTVTVTPTSPSPLVVTIVPARGVAPQPVDTRTQRRDRNRTRRDTREVVPRTQTPTPRNAQSPRQGQRTGDLHDPWLQR